jgi:hypothetical protein
MKKQILSEEFKRMQKLAGIITESQLTKYTVDDFILQNDGKDYYDPFFDAIYKYKTILNIDPDKQEGWDKITSMSEEELVKNYKLTPNVATKVKNVFKEKLKEEYMPDTDYEDKWEKGGGPDEEEADLFTASIMKKGTSIPGYEDQTYMSDTLVGEDGEEFENYRTYSTYEEAVDDATNPTTGFTLPGVNIYKLEDGYAVTFPNTPSKSEFAGKFN